MRASIVVVILSLACACLADFSYSSFNATIVDENFDILGQAAFDEDNSSIELIPSTKNKNGGTFYTNSQYILAGFVTQFTYQISNSVGLGGAGLAFIVQPESATTEFLALGSIGAGIGYGDQSNGQGGIVNSVAIEFDCYYDESMNDPNNNHVGVHSRNTDPNSSNESAVILSLVNNSTDVPSIISSSTVHTVSINYQAAASSLVVTLDDVVVLSANNFNLAEQITFDAGSGDGFVGITSSSYANDYFELEILSWDFNQGNGTIVPASTIIYGPGYEGAVYGATSTYSIQLIDSFGFDSNQPGSDQGIDVSCALYGTDGTNITCTATYVSAGLYQATYNANQAGDFTLTTVVGDYINTTDITIDAPAPYAPNCNAIGDGLANATAGVSATFTIYTFDQSDAPIPGGDATFTITLTLTTDTSVVVNGAASTNNDGTYTASYTVTVAGTYSLDVILVADDPNGGPIQGSPFTVVAVAGVYSASNSYAFGSGIESGVAGGQNTFYVQAVDAFGNNATSPDTWVLTSVSGSPLVENSTSTSVLGDGLSINYYEQNGAGVFLLSVADVSGTEIKSSPFNVSIEAAGAFPDTTVASGVSNATAGVLQTITITPYDQYGNLVYNSNLQFDVVINEGQSDNSTIPVSYQDGNYIGTYNLTIAGPYTISISLVDGGAATGPISGSPFTVYVTSGEIDVSNSYAEGGGLSTAQAGELASFTIYAVDYYGNNVTTQQSTVFELSFDSAFNGTINEVVANPDGTFLGSYTPFNTGTFSLSVTSGSESIIGSPFTVVVSAGPAYGPSSVPEGAGYTSAAAGDVANFTIQAYDQYGNPTEDGGSCYGNLNNTDNSYPVTCTYVSGNTYEAYYNATAAGLYQLNVYINGLLIQNSPSNVTVLAGPVDAASSTASGDGLTAAQAGVIAYFSVTPRDQFGNAVADSSLTVNITLTKEGATAYGVVFYSGGTYWANYTLYTPTGTWSLSVTINGVDISGSPFSPVLSAGDFSIANSFAFPTTSSQVLANGAAYEPNTFWVQAVDVYSNNITTSVDAIFTAVVVSNTTGNTVLTTNANYAQNGQYEFVFTIDNSDNYNVAVTDGTTPILNSPLSLYISAGLPVANETIATGFGVSFGVAGQNSNFTITTRDAGGNIYPEGGATFSFNLFYTNTEANNATGVVTAVDNGDGTYSCSYNVTLAGNWTLEITLESTPAPGLFVAAGNQIQGSPYYPIIFAGENCPENAQVLNLNETGEVNVVQSFDIQSADCYGNFVETANVYYDVLVSGPDCTFGNSAYIGLGLVSVNFTVSLPGNYSIEIMERGVPINGSPYPVTITGTGAEDDNNELSSTSLLFMWLMIVFIILYVIACLLLVGFVVFTQRKQLQRGFSSNYKRIHSDSSSSSSSD